MSGRRTPGAETAARREACGGDSRARLVVGAWLGERRNGLVSVSSLGMSFVGKLEGNGSKDEQAEESRKLTFIFLDSPGFGLHLTRIDTKLEQHTRFHKIGTPHPLHPSLSCQCHTLTSSAWSQKSFDLHFPLHSF